MTVHEELGRLLEGLEAQVVIQVVPPEPLAYRPRDVARLLSCAERTVYLLLERGALRACRVGRAMRVPRSEVERFIREQLDEEPV